MSTSPRTATLSPMVTTTREKARRGLGEAVLSALAEAGAAPERFVKLAVTGMPHFGKPEELMDAFGISARHIIVFLRIPAQNHNF